MGGWTASSPSQGIATAVPAGTPSIVTVTNAFASAVPVSQGVRSRVIPSVNVEGNPGTPLSLLGCSSASPAIRRAVDQQIQQVVVTDIARAVFDFQLQVM